MKIYHNFLETKKNKTLIIISIIWIILGFVVSFFREVSALNIINTVLHILTGLLLILMGMGKDIRSFFGKSYLDMNETSINYKRNLFKKEITMLWKEVKNIDYKSNSFHFSDENDQKVVIKLGELLYEKVKEVKKVIEHIAKEHNIEINYIKY